MAMDRDYYAVLGVAPGTPHEDVQRAFRQKILTAHPDRGGSARQMLAIKEAWETLRDAGRRAAYDAERGFGKSGASGAGRGAAASGVGRSGTTTRRAAGRRGSKKKGPRPPTLAQIAGAMLGKAFRALLGSPKPKAKRKAVRPGAIVRCGRCGQKLRVRVSGARIVCPRCRHVQAGR